MPLTYSVTKRALDNLLLPTSGYVINAQLGGAVLPVLTDERFVRATTRFVNYRPLGAASTLILRAEAGALASKRKAGVPSTFLFRAGGDQSVRGYAYQELGVLEGTAIVAGRYLLTGSAEYQYWFKPPWGVAVFYDAGNAADTLARPASEIGLRRRRALAQPGRPDQRRSRLRPRGQESAPALLTGIHVLMADTDNSGARPAGKALPPVRTAPLAAPARHRRRRHRRAAGRRLLVRRARIDPADAGAARRLGQRRQYRHHRRDRFAVRPMHLGQAGVPQPRPADHRRQYRIDWSPFQYLSKGVAINRLHVASLTMQTLRDTEPAKMPVSLAPPFQLAIDDARWPR